MKQQLQKVQNAAAGFVLNKYANITRCHKYKMVSDRKTNKIFTSVNRSQSKL